MEMDLRMVLLVIGTLIMGAIVLDGFRRKKKIQRQVKNFEETVLSSAEEEDKNPFTESDPLLEEGILAKRTFKPQKIETPLKQQPPSPAGEQTSSSEPAGEVVGLSILCEQGWISGRALNAVIQSNQLKFGEKRIYHKHRGDKIDGELLYSMASVTKPGYFEPNKMVTSQFKGVLLFMVPSKVSDPLQTFERMLSTARMMGASLQATVCDASRQPLTAKKVERMKESVKRHEKKVS